MNTQVEINKKVLELIENYGNKEIAIKVTDEIKLELKYKISDTEERNARFYFWLSVKYALNEL